LALRGEGRYTSYTQAEWNLFTGEINAIWTPHDRVRVDLCAARIVIADNMASLEHKLVGRYTGGGMDLRVTSADTLSVSVDGTRWSEGNLRMRYRFSPSHRFEGVPRVVVSWPTMYQTYDRGFPFGLFSPQRYIETGPAVQVSKRPRRHWEISVYGRIGSQRESGTRWKPLASLRGQVERELGKRWGFLMSGGWTTSDLASPTGWRRTSFSMGLRSRF
jgi:hypothetical protein